MLNTSEDRTKNDSDEPVRITIEVPKDVRNKLKARAADEGKSIKDKLLEMIKKECS